MREYTVNDILQMFLKQWKLFVVGVLICGVLGFSYTAFFVPKTYQSSGMMYVNNRDTSHGQSINTAANINDLYAAERLSESFKIILKTEKFLNYVVEDTGLDITARQLKGMLSVSTYENTEIIEVRVVSHDAAEANTIVASILYNAKTKLGDILDVGHIEIIEDASFSKSPVGSNVQLNTFIAMFLGAVLVAVFAIFKEMTNTTILSELDIENLLDIPIIGLIPDLNEAVFDDEANYAGMYKQ